MIAVTRLFFDSIALQRLNDLLRLLTIFAQIDTGRCFYRIRLVVFTKQDEAYRVITLCPSKSVEDEIERKVKSGRWIRIWEARN